MALACVAACGRDGGDATGAGSERVVLETSVESDITKPILDAFESETGIRVEVRRDGKPGALGERVRGEGDAPRADVVWSRDVFGVIDLARAGLLTPMDEAALADWPASERDPGGMWAAIDLQPRVIAFNIKRLRPEDAPRLAIELPDPRLRDRVVMTRPRAGAPLAHVAALCAVWGDDTTRWWLGQVRDNGLRVVESDDELLRMVARGEVDVGIVDADEALGAQRRGEPIGLFPVEHIGTYSDPALRGSVLVLPGAVAMVKGGPHGAEAARLVSFLLSERVERMLVQGDARAVPMRSSVAADVPDRVIEDRMVISYETIADHMGDASALCDEVLR